ncbi:MAG: universal stress protein [Vicinamibacterales bacterium]|nr:universal stress protein [Vicinamibacterales bacterium]
MWTCPPARIVVAVDFGEPALAAVRVAAPLARRLGAALIAVHAETLEAPPYFTSDQIGALEAQRAAAREAAERHLRDVVGDTAGGPVDARVVAGPATSVLVDAAADADLIVIGTHGRRGPSRWWLGSVAERVARSSPVPVLVVHDAPAAAEPFASVLVIGHPNQGRSARCAELLAAQTGGQVHYSDSADAPVVARTSGATLVVVPRGPEGTTAALTAAGPALIRDCRLPILVIPEDPS